MGDITTHQRAELRRQTEGGARIVAMYPATLRSLLDALDERERRVKELEEALQSVRKDCICGHGEPLPADDVGSLVKKHAALAKEEG